MIRKILFINFFLLSSFHAISQRIVKDSTLSMPWVAIHYGGNWTSGDLAKQTGFLNHIGFLGGYKTNKNYFWGIEGNYIFGRDVRVSGLFDDIVDSYGNITDMNGDIAIVGVYSRGFNANLTFGKVIPIFNSNTNSGLMLNFGAGILAHKLRIESQDQVIPSIELDYKKGYDRLAMGPNFNQFIGYSFMANRGLVNFYTGFYLQEGFTKNMRTVFFDQPDIPVSTKTMIDIQAGFKFGWLIPIYKRLPKEFYYD